MYLYPYIPSARYGHSSSYAGLYDKSTTYPRDGTPVFRKYMYLYGGFALDCTTACTDLWAYEISYGPYNYYPRHSDKTKWHNFGNHWKMVNDGVNYGPGSRWRNSMVTH
jgi:hypothetical protein